MLKDRVSIQRMMSAPDGAGGHPHSPVTIATVWGRLTVKRSNQFTSAMQLQENHTHIIFVRKSVDCIGGDKVVVDGITYDVLTVDSFSGSIYKQLNARVIL